MIEVRGLKKTFDGFAALDGADLSVPRGAVYGLVGPNGAGKTTLLRHLTGVYHQDSGSVTFDGQPVWENVDVKARIASIPDDWFYFMQAGLRDMMRFYRGLYPKFDQERFEKLREVFALDEKRPLRRMSKGQQKQAAFWLALCTMPDYLILDEPVDGLDPVMRRQVWSLILQDVAERGTTVLVSSHNLRELEDVCDHVGVMSRGKLLLEHSLSELQDYTVKLQLAFEGAELPALPQEIKVVHYVGNPGTSAAANRSFFANLALTHETYASAHFVVGLEGEILQCVPLTEIAYCSNTANDYTVSIEVCHPDDTGKFNDATMESLEQLVAWLCDTFSLDPDADVIRHYDVTGKICPKYYVENEDAWLAFRQNVSARIEEDKTASGETN